MDSAEILHDCSQGGKDQVHRVKTVFSTDPNPNRSKTKCILFSGNSSRVRNPDPVMLDGKDLPWVEKCEHLGHVFSQSLSMESDSRVARSSFMKRAESQ